MKPLSTLHNLYQAASLRTVLVLQQHSTAAMFFLGVVVLTGGALELSSAQGGGPTGSFSEAGFEDDLIRNSVGNLLKLIEGAFGALVMIVAGLIAIIAAAMGAYRAALGMLVVAVGSFILRALVSLFFGSDFGDFDSV